MNHVFLLGLPMQWFLNFSSGSTIEVTPEVTHKAKAVMVF
jgi:hypothetical protein